MTVKIKLNRNGVRDLLRSQEVKADLARRARSIAVAAGPGHEVQTVTGRNRARSTIRTETDEAKLAEQNTQNLTRAIGAGRG